MEVEKITSNTALNDYEKNTKSVQENQINTTNSQEGSTLNQEKLANKVVELNQAPIVRRLSGQISKYKYSKYRRIILIVLAMLISAIASRYFIIYANIFSSGVAGVSQGIIYTIAEGLDLANLKPEMYITVKNVGFYIVNTFFNLFIFWFTIKKFGRQFAFWSLAAFAISVIWGLFFNYTPGFNSAAFIPGFVPVYSGSNWEQIAVTFAVTAIAGTIAGIMTGIATGIIFKLGISGLGFDPISKWLAKEKKISVKKAIFIFSLINSTLWILIGQGITGQITSFSTFINSVFNARLVGTVLFLAVNSVAIGWFYPAGKTVEIEINTSKGYVISDQLNTLNYHRGHSIESVIGGRHRSNRQKLKVVLMAEEMYEFINIVSGVDEEAFIIVKQVTGIFGNFDSSQRFKDPLVEEQHHREERRQSKQHLISSTVKNNNKNIFEQWLSFNKKNNSNQDKNSNNNDNEKK